MDILSYLFELLQQRKEVGITGLGTFYKKKYPGRYDKETQSFLPPGYILQFTVEVKSENTLIDYISAKRNLSKESAQYYISQFTEEVNKKLEEEHEAVLDNIGRLFFTEHEGLSFEPAKHINYGSEFFGLPSLSETTAEAPQIILPDSASQDNGEDEVYDEIAEAPNVPKFTEKTSEPDVKLPAIENIELDEVKDDFKNTLKQVFTETEQVTEAPDFIKEQHAEHPNRFGNSPDVEEVTDAPDFIKEQHTEHPNRFGHTPEVEGSVKAALAAHLGAAQTEEKTYHHLDQEQEKHETVIEAPAFIKEQHAEHPNRFGHDPLSEQEEPEPKKMSTWLIITNILLALIIIAAVLYYFKPELFKALSKEESAPVVATVAIDSNQLAIDTAKAKQDSVAKTDSVLKANQIATMKLDTIKAANTVNTTTKVVIPVTEKSMFHVIAVSYKTEAAAQQYIDKVKKMGLKATIAKMEGKLKKVSIASFPTNEEAEKQKLILQERLKGKGFYVKEIKNNTQP